MIPLQIHPRHYAGVSATLKTLSTTITSLLCGPTSLQISIAGVDLSQSLPPLTYTQSIMTDPSPAYD